MNPDKFCEGILPSMWDKPEVQLTKEDIEHANMWAAEMYRAKIDMGERPDDLGSFVKRETSGRCGEIAVEKLLGMEFVDWSISASKKHNRPDLEPIGLRCGIKSSSIGVEKPNVPLVPIVPMYSQVIVILRPNKYKYEFGDLASICGVATREVMMRHSSMELVRSRNVRGKIGFCGFEYLIPFSSFEELEAIIG